MIKDKKIITKKSCRSKLLDKAYLVKYTKKWKNEIMRAKIKLNK